MDANNIYRDIAERTGGDIYIGVVGPVRTGKSTFIKRFMETLVLPNIADPYDRERARDEMPQSAAGRTIMTTEPKFIPDEAVKVKLAENAEFRVRMIDCVGYIVEGVSGHEENDSPRMVMTPWSDSAVPFGEAAETGTRRVISEHSTIGVVVTTDGSIGELPREAYEQAEARVAGELKQIDKPYAVVLNTANPNSESAVKLAAKLSGDYGAPCIPVNCLELSGEDIRKILEVILLEFPVREVKVNLPGWTRSLESDFHLMKNLREAVMECASKVEKSGDIPAAFSQLSENENVAEVLIKQTDLGNGRTTVSLQLNDDLYYNVMNELTGFEIDSEDRLITLMRELAEVKRKYDRVSQALEEVERKGYGIVTPEESELSLEEPEIIKHGGGYGIKLKASAPSVHMIKVDTQTEISPMVGTEQQSEDMVKYLMKEFDGGSGNVWKSNIFGKTLYELVNEGLHSKLENMPDEARQKLSETLRRIINEGSGGLICIIL
nr:stage IV sporulation protein A [Clostridia bacterium]